MASINNVVLAGNIGQDPQEIKGGARFSLATTYRRKIGENEYEDVTDWHTIVTFGNQARFVLEFARKGMAVTVSGAISYYRDEEKGVTYTSIRARDIVLPKQGNAAPRKAKAANEEPFEAAGEDDIPWD